MASHRAASEVGYVSMKRHFPRWVASNSTELQAASQPDDNHSDDEYIDFVLSSNWILRPAGLSEFYDQIRKRIENPSITYEIEVGCFQIRCRRHEQQDVVIACNEIMDELVKDVINAGSEDEQLIIIGTSNNDKVRYISEWRAEPPQQAEIESYQVFSYPSEIVTFPFRGTWKIPKSKVQDGLTIRKLFLSHDPVKLMRDTTNCAVIRSTDGLALHFGANSPEEICEAEQKMENILKYYDLDSQIGIHQNVIFAEDNSTGLVELRYLAQVDRRYLRNVILDPTRFRPGTDYRKLFEKGSFLRSLKREQGQLVSAAAQASPAVPQEVVLEPFFPFLGWRTKFANHDWDITALTVLDDDYLNQVNPLATPRVLEWANALPPFQSLSIIQDWEASEQPRSRDSTLDLHANESINGIYDLITIDNSPVQPQGYGHDASLRMNRHIGEFVTSPGGPSYRSLGTMKSDPHTIVASSLNHGNRTGRPPHFRASGSPRTLRRSRIDADNTTDHMKASSTNSVELENHFTSLQEKLNSLNLNTFQEVNMAITDKLSEAEPLVRLASEVDSDKSLFGEFYAPQARQENSWHEPLVIPSTSHKRSAQDVDMLLPAPTLMDNNINSIQLSTPMKQKMLGSRPAMTRIKRRGLDPDTENRIHEHLSEMLEPYRLYQGLLTLRAEIGRFWFTKIDWQYISIPGLQNQTRSKPVDSMEYSLKSHCVSQDLYFNNILTLFGGDANYIGNLPDIDNSAARMWVPGCRRGFYEFWCATKCESGFKAYFIVEIDGTNFRYKVRKADPTESNIHIHCAKRDFDFRVAIEATSDIENNYGAFAREIVSSLRVTPQGSGSNLPVLEFSNFRDWGVEIKNVRYRQVATFDHCDNNTKLHITQVHCMKKKTAKKGDIVWHLSATADLAKPDAGYFTTWFEAYITSNKVDEALAQNRGLTFAEEAHWTPENLLDSGAIDDLLNSATNTVQQMDGVGFHVNNQQDDMRYGKPPHTREEASVQAEAYGHEYSYW